jgi:hypothetical protein
MKRHLKLAILAFAMMIVLVATIIIVNRPDKLEFDLRDGTRLELVKISVSTNHVAHFGNDLQKLLFRTIGPRLDPKWIGYSMVTPSQDSLNGNLGIFVVHRLPVSSSGLRIDLLHNYKIRPVSLPRKEHTMFLSSGQGIFGLWELNYWNEAFSDFQIENFRGELVGRFKVARDKNGHLEIVRSD